MRVVFLRSNPVNPDPRIEKQVKSLASNGHDVVVVCWDRSGILPKSDFLYFENIKVPIYRGGGKAAFGGGLKTIIKLLGFQFFLMSWLFLNRSSYDVIHAADFDTVLPAILLKLFFKKKVVYDIFDFYADAFSVPKKMQSIIKKIDRFVINTADGVIITNESRFEQISGTNPKQIIVVHNSPSHLSNTCRNLLLPERLNKYEHVFAYVGILQPGRLLLELLELFKRKPNWLLNIAGFGALEQQIKDCASSYDNIKYFGTVKYDDGIKISASADILFATYDPSIPNHKYSSPNKLYEAMLLSKPIIVCESTGIDIIVNSYNIGASIGYSSVEFEYAVNSFLSSATVRREMGERANDLFEKQYSWEIMEKRLIQLYGNI